MKKKINKIRKERITEFNRWHDKWLCMDVRDFKKMSPKIKILTNCHSLGNDSIMELSSDELRTMKKWHKKKMRQYLKSADIEE